MGGQEDGGRPVGGGSAFTKGGRERPAERDQDGKLGCREILGVVFILVVLEGVGGAEIGAGGVCLIEVAFADGDAPFGEEFLQKREGGLVVGGKVDQVFAETAVVVEIFIQLRKIGVRQVDGRGGEDDEVIARTPADAAP